MFCMLFDDKQAGPWSHPAFCLVRIRDFFSSGGKRPGRGADHSPNLLLRLRTSVAVRTLQPMLRGMYRGDFTVLCVTLRDCKYDGSQQTIRYRKCGVPCGEMCGLVTFLCRGKPNRYLLIPLCVIYYWNQTVSVTTELHLPPPPPFIVSTPFPYSYLQDPLTNMNCTPTTGCHYTLLTHYRIQCICYWYLYC
jgi:hypothetical protein